MKKRKISRNTFRHCVRTTQERRAAQDCPYVRAKRNHRNLPSDWDDIRIHDWERRSWKNRRKTQYRDKPRGKRNEIVLQGQYWSNSWKLRLYFEEHDIPYNITKVYENKVGYTLWVAEKIVWWYDKDIGLEYII